MDRKRLLSFTGPSGVGKTTIARELITALPGSRMVASYTTRAPRESDIDGEYIYVTEAILDSMEQNGELLWRIKHASNQYATAAHSVKEIADGDTYGIMLLAPDVIPLLQNYLQSIGRLSIHLPIFIAPPKREVLEERMHKRGDNVAETNKRLDEAAQWEEQAKKQSVHYRFIRNDGKIQDAVEAALQLTRDTA